MKRRNYKFWIRKTHRYLGIFIGIQFLAWTLGGVYFSWMNIKDIRGDNLRKGDHAMIAERDFVSPKTAIDVVRSTKNIAGISQFRIIDILGEPFYEIEVMISPVKHETAIVGAVNGRLRESLSETEAKRIAVDSMKTPKDVASVLYLTTENVGPHHEYREKPLPAWAVTFDDGLTIYLSAQTGQIGAYRTNEWRVFDFLWMLHTMDFAERDNINNYLLRGFSVLGIVTLLSGFLLFFVSSPLFRRVFQRK